MGAQVSMLAACPPLQADCRPRPLRFEAQDFVPASRLPVAYATHSGYPGTPMFLWPDPCQRATVQPQPVEETVETRGAKCTASALEGSEPEPPLEVQDDVQSDVLQKPQPKKPMKKLLNARLRPKGGCMKEILEPEVSDLPAQEWGSKALDAIRASEPGKLHQKHCLTDSDQHDQEPFLDSDFASLGDGSVPLAAPSPKRSMAPLREYLRLCTGQTGQDPAKLVSEDQACAAAAQKPGWQLLTRAAGPGSDAVALRQVDPNGPSPVHSAGQPADLNSLGRSSELDKTCLHEEYEDVADGLITTVPSEENAEETWPAGDESSLLPGYMQCDLPDDDTESDPWAFPWADNASEATPDAEEPRRRDTPTASSQDAESEVLPFEPEPGTTYDRGWIKYRDPSSGEIWFHNQHTEEFFFAQYSREEGWLPFQSSEGRKWWWHDKNRRFFFEDLK